MRCIFKKIRLIVSVVVCGIFVSQPPVLASLPAQAGYYTYVKTDFSYGIVVISATVEGNLLDSGDEIGVFDVTVSGDTLCVGAIICEAGDDTLGFSAWRDDTSQTSDEQDGYIAGHSMIFRIYDASTGIEYAAEPVYASGSGAFGEGQYAVISSLTAVAVNKFPVLAAMADTAVHENDFFFLQAQAVDADGDSLVYSLTSSPPGMAINSLTGALSWTPGYDQAGVYDITVRVEDGSGGDDAVTFRLTVINVNRKPELAAAIFSNATEDNPYSDTLAVHDPDRDDAFIFELLTAPAWLSVYTVDSLGILTGMPVNDDVGMDFPLVIRVIDSGGLTDTLNSVISVLNTNDPPVIITTFLPLAMESIPYADTIVVYDPDENDRFTFSMGIGPSWLSIDTSGVLHGVPAAGDIGVSSLSIRVEDSGGLADTLSTTVTVIRFNNPPAFITAALPDAVEDSLYSFTLIVHDPDAGDYIIFSILAGPAWLTVNDDGALSGAPTNDDVGADIPFSVRATDSGGLSDTLNTAVSVINTNDPPVFRAAILSNAAAYAAYADTVYAHDPDTGDELSFGIATGPRWLAIETVDTMGILSGAPTNDDAGTDIPVSITVTDAGNLSDTLAMTMDVIRAPVITAYSPQPDTVITEGDSVRFSISFRIFIGKTFYYTWYYDYVPVYSGAVTAGPEAPLDSTFTIFMAFPPGSQGEHLIRIAITDGKMFEYATWNITVQEPVSVGDEKQHLPGDFYLFQNYPNPFNPETNILFLMPRASFVTLKIYNSMGQLVKTLAAQRLNRGLHTFTWDGTDDTGQPVSSGLYLCRFHAGAFSAVRRIAFIK